MSCLGYLHQFSAKFDLQASQVPRPWNICSCYCPRCNANHTCFKPDYFLEEDLQKKEDIPWCCMKPKAP